MSIALPLSLHAMSPMQLLGRRSDGRMLGAACIGGGCAECASHCLGAVPVQRIVAPVLGGEARGEDFGEAWQSATDCRSGERDGIHFRADADTLYGVIEIDENAFAGSAEKSPLHRATEEAYRRLFSLLDAEGYRHLWRVWNYLADINVEEATAGGLERYRQFNAGRQDAFIACGRLIRDEVPAACALGVRQGPLTIAFMAGRLPALTLENPRQVSAWDYPGDYGPRAPTFARATLVELPRQTLLFISGTASIVGHRTLHVGDAAAQTREAMTNVAAMVDAANAALGLPEAYRCTALDYRVYVRHAGDYEVVRNVLQPVVGDARIVHVQADICRADLLVEIEATGSWSREN